jgi:hypothetical protein
MKRIWYTSGFIFLAGFFIIAPLMKILHWRGNDFAFLISALAGIVFIPITLSYVYKKIK